LILLTKYKTIFIFFLINSIILLEERIFIDENI